MTGFEKLKGMTAEDAAKMLGSGCPYSNYYGFCPEGAGSERCKACWLDWLESDEDVMKAVELRKMLDIS